MGKKHSYSQPIPILTKTSNTDERKLVYFRQMRNKSHALIMNTVTV